MKLLAAVVVVCLAPSLLVAGEPTYLLKSDLRPGTAAHVKVELQAGGDKLIATEEEESNDFHSKLRRTSTTKSKLSPGLRNPRPSRGRFVITTPPRQSSRSMTKPTNVPCPNRANLLLAEVRDGLTNFAGSPATLTREQWDLVNVEANTLAIDRLLPGREVAEGESWDHDAATMGALLCMDHVGVCEVSSVATSETERQVQIRLAGTVDGTVDGTPTEMELRTAYLFHLDEKRITRFNLAIKEVRKPSDLLAGVDVVAKAFVTIDPERKPLDVPAKVRKLAGQTNTPLPRTLAYESPTKAFRSNTMRPGTSPPRNAICSPFVT